MCFPVNAGVDQVDHVLKATVHNGFPIVTPPRTSSTDPIDANQPKPDHEGGLKGFMLRSDVICMIYGNFMKKHNPTADDPNPASPTWEDFTALYPRMIEYDAVNYEADRLYLDFKDIMDTTVETVTETSNLRKVYKMVRSRGIRHLIVTDDYRNVRGMITRKDIYQFVNHSWLWRKEKLQRRTRVTRAKGCWVVLS